MNNTLEQALRYAEQGYYVRPNLSEQSLMPIASTDDKVLHDWWQRYPEAGLILDGPLNHLWFLRVLSDDLHLYQDLWSGHQILSPPLSLFNDEFRFIFRDPLEAFTWGDTLTGIKFISIDTFGLPVESLGNQYGQHNWAENRSILQAPPPLLPDWLMEGLKPKQPELK